MCLFSIRRPSGLLGQRPRYLVTESLNHPECWETFFIALFKSGWFFLHCFLTTFCLGLHLQWLSVLSLGSHFCQLLKCLVLVGAETGARRK